MDLFTWIVFAGAIALFVVYHAASGPKRWWRPEKAAIVFLASALGVAVAILQLRAAALRSQEDLAHRRLEVAFRYMEKWRSPEMRQHHSRVGTALDSMSRLSETATDSLVRTRPDLGTGLNLMFDLFEDAALAVNTGYADDRTLCLYFAGEGLQGPATATWRSLAKWITHLRVVAKDDELYLQYQRLAEHWTRTRCRNGYSVAGATAVHS